MSSSHSRGWAIGIDEVGRGPLAGPVVVCALALPARFPCAAPGLGPLRDSKRLTRAARERWSAALRRHPRVRYALAWVSPGVIDRVNIARAANLAAWRAYARLARTVRSGTIYLDGGLYLKRRGWAAGAGIRAETVIRGDERIMAVAAASIVAKVARDRAMKRLAKRHPGYGFEAHQGYGTAAHRAAIRRRGPSPAHRRTFIRPYLKIPPARGARSFPVRRGGTTRV